MNYPEKEYKKSIFSFTSGELREISGFDTVIKMGDMAKILITNYINGVTLKRLGVRNSPDIGLQYNIEKGTLDIYEPKFWCTKCNIKKATFSYLDKAYCEACFEILKAEAAKKKQKKRAKLALWSDTL